MITLGAMKVAFGAIGGVDFGNSQEFSKNEVALASFSNLLFHHIHFWFFICIFIDIVQTKDIYPLFLKCGP